MMDGRLEANFQGLCWISGVYNYQSNTSQDPKEPSHTLVSNQSSELQWSRPDTSGKQENQKNQR